MQTGVVKRYLNDKKYGFIGRTEGPDLFYHLAATRGEVAPRTGDRVEFDVVDTPKGPQARAVRVVSHG